MGKRFTEEEEQKIKDMYYANVLITDMAKEFGVTLSNMARVIKRREKSGVLVKRDESIRYTQRKERTEPRKPQKPRTIKPKEKKPKKRSKVPIITKPKNDLYEPDGIIVNCTDQVAITCVYGCRKEFKGAGLCNYIGVTKHMRGCPHTACDKYTKITDAHARYEINYMEY